MTEALQNILYVEDDMDIAEITLMALEDLGGFTVRHCQSGKEALDVFSNWRPQLVLTDVMMPDMDGVETMQNIREMPHGKEIPFVFMTAKVQMHEQEVYVSQGALGVIPKPFDPVTLGEKINKLWESHHH